MKNILIIISFVLTLNAIEIKQLPLDFGETRVELTRQYIKNS